MTDFIPPWMDAPTLARHICVSSTTVDNWVARGILPPPRKRGGKLLWKWSEVDKALSEGANDEKSELERIQDGTRRAAGLAADH